jgi:hypothetical protein
VQFIPSFSIMGCCCSGAYYFSADNLPDGLSIDPQTGAITGTLGYDFVDQANSPVTLSSTIRLHQQDLCTGETIEATGTIYWHIYDNNRLPTASSFSLENLTDSSRSSSPRTKDNLRFTVGQVSDPDGDPVFVTIEWQVNGQTVQTTSGTVSSFDLSVPGHGDVGDTITVIVKLNDGSGDFEVYSTTVTVDNTPPVVTSIIVEGAQAFEDGVYYFVEGQEATIRIRVQDDDLEQSPDRETVRVSLAEGALPPGLELSGPDYYPEVDANGEAVIRGTIQPHGAAEATQYYRPRFRVWDSSGADNVSPFIQVGATDFRATSVIVHGLSSDPAAPTSIRGTTLAAPYRFTISVYGCGSPVAGGKQFLWYVKDNKTGTYLFSAVAATAPAGTGPLGVWRKDITIWLYDDAGKVGGMDRSVGADADLTIEICDFRPPRILWTSSGKWYVTTRP